MSEIDWSALPDQAEWVAMDENGRRWWFADGPRLRIDMGVWDSTGDSGDIDFDDPSSDWKNSLQQRPQSALTVSVPSVTPTTKKTITETKSVTVSRRDIERMVADAVGLSRHSEVSWEFYATYGDEVESLTITQIKTTEEV